MELDIISYLRQGWLEVGSTRMVLLEVRGGFYAIRDSLEMLVGPDVTERVLYEAGNAGGISYANSAVTAGTVPPGVDGFPECVRVYSRAGFGDFAVEALDPGGGYAVVSCRDSFESWAYREHGRLPARNVCDYSSGVLAGFLRALTGRHDLECVELQCAVHGGPQCLFEVRPFSGASSRYRPVEVWQSAILARENANLRAEAERRSEQLLRQNANLSMLVELASTLSQSPDLGDALRLALDTVVEHYRAAGGLVCVRTVGGHRPALFIHSSIPARVARSLVSVPVEDYFFGIGIGPGERLRLLDLHAEPRSPAREVASAGFRTAAVVALPYRDRVVGAMALLWRGPSGLSDDDLTLLGAVGRQIGIAVENAKLLQSAADLAIEKERNRIARELHDSVNQTLFSMVLTLNALVDKTRGDPRGRRQAEIAGALGELRDMAAKALAEMRGMMSQLRPVGLEGERLGVALCRYSKWLRAQTGIAVDFVISGMKVEEELDPIVEDTIYRIAQEALANAIRHSGAKRIVVALSKLPRSIKLEVRDNGQGFVPQDEADGKRLGLGLGLTNMRDRAQMLGGKFQVRSKLGRGTGVTVEIPL